MPVEINILGPVELVVDDTVCCLPRLERGLLGILAANIGRVVSVERLIDGLWANPPSGARNRIQALVATLRRQLPEGILLTRSPGYLLSATVTIDAEKFGDLVGEASNRRADGQPHEAAELLDDALALWRGDAFADVASPLVDVDRVRLHELREHAREERIDALLDRGRHRELVPELVRGVTDQPLRTRLRGQLMVALQRSGRVPEALAVYRDGAHLLAEEHGLDPGAELRRLHHLILNEDATDELHAATVRPYQLPGTIGDFVGREKELAELRALLAQPPKMPGAARIVVISGLPGVGKSTLALRVGHEHRHCFPGGALFADLRGRHDEPAAPAAVLGAFLRSLGVPGRSIPSDLDERAALYRSMLADQQILVVLDSAANEAQVRPLLPPGPSCAIVTAAAGLAGLAGAYHLPLAVLDPGDGMQLLARLADADRVGPDPESSAQIVEVCGGLPLALRIVGVRLAHREALPLARLRDALLDERRRLDELALGDLSVRTSFAVGAKSLSLKATRLLGVLAHTPARSHHAWDSRYEGAMEELCRAQMLTAEGGARLRMHDLVRLYAREAFKPEEHEVIEYYQALLRHAEQAARALPCKAVPAVADASPHMSGEEAMRWFADEYDNLLTASDDALALGGRELAGRLTATMTNFVIIRSGYRLEWEPRAQAVLAADGELSVPTELALMLGAATVERLSDRPGAALQTFRRAYRLARGRFPEQELLALLSWALVARHRGMLRQADMALRVAVSRCSDGNATTPAVGYVYFGLGHRLAQYRATNAPARAALQTAQEILRDGGDRWGHAVATETLGILCTFEGDNSQAALQLRQAIDAYRGLDDRLSATIAEQALAKVHLDLGDVDTARSLLQHTAAAFTRMHFTWGEGVSRRLLARLHLDTGVPAQALPELDRAAELLRQLEQPVSLARVFAVRARVLAALARPYDAVAAADAALAIFDQYGCDDGPELRVLRDEWQHTTIAASPQ